MAPGHSRLIHGASEPCILTRSPNRNGPGRATFPENSEQGNTKHEDGMKIGQVKGFICLIILIVVSKPQFHFMGDLGPPHHFSLRLILVTAHSNTIWNMRRAPVISNSIWFGLDHGSHGPSSTVPRRWWMDQRGSGHGGVWGSPETGPLPGSYWDAKDLQLVATMNPRWHLGHLVGQWGVWKMHNTV